MTSKQKVAEIFEVFQIFFAFSVKEKIRLLYMQPTHIWVLRNPTYTTMGRAINVKLPFKSYDVHILE